MCMHVLVNKFVMLLSGQLFFNYDALQRIGKGQHCFAILKSVREYHDEIGSALNNVCRLEVFAVNPFSVTVSNVYQK